MTRLEISDAAVADAIAAEAGYMEELLARLVEAPTLLGNEEPGQELMREAFRELGLEPADVPLDADALRAHPAASPFSWDVSGKANVITTWGSGGGRSLILNGHVDVVPPAAESLWRTAPFRATRDGDWLFGRGAGDMKAGLAAIVGADSLTVTVRGDAVTLSGTVRSRADHDTALTAAAAAPGVTDVHDELRVMG